VRAGATLTNEEARRLAIAAQGLARPRPAGPIGPRHLRALFETVGQMQLDTINVLERTQFLVPFSRFGDYPRETLHALTGPHGDLFEYWGHAVALLPMAHYPLFRWRMAQEGTVGDRPVYAARREQFRREHAGYIAAVFAEVRARGPLTARQLSDPRPRDGEWWARRSFGRVALEYLFLRGDLAGWRTPAFERVYDLPERVIPDEVRAQPAPAAEDAQRRLVAIAARALGVATTSDLAAYYALKPQIVRRCITELVDAGELVAVTVDGWKDPAYALPGARTARLTRTHATLLSPFDSLIWERARTLRLFGFDYRIEVYVPESKRRYGYFVMPLLLGDRLVARFDVKADRSASALQVRGSYVEPDIDARSIADAAADELESMRRWLGLDRLVVARRGNLAAALRAARTREWGVSPSSPSTPR